MKPSSTHVLFAAVALGALALGVAALRFLPDAGKGAARTAGVAAPHVLGGGIAPGLRRALSGRPQQPAPQAAQVEAPANPKTAEQPAPPAAPVPPASLAAAPPMAPVPAAAPPLPSLALGAPPLAASAPTPAPPAPPQETAAEAVEGVVSFPETAPTPPVRPPELQKAETAVPLPPPRPRDLVALERAPGQPPTAPDPQATSQAPPQAASQPPAQAAPQPAAPASGWSFPQWPQAGAPAATPGPEAQQVATAHLYVDAPLPPARPADLDRLAAAAPATKAAPVATRDAAPATETAAPAGAQVARLEEPTLRAAPDDAFQSPPPKVGMGDPVFVRIFKQEGQLELWLKKNGRYALYKTFPICKWSGRLGPKLREADYQSPEGFYSVSAKQLNPHSNYYRAFNVGYPNAFDRQNGRTGGLVMVHGACKSVGCFAMTDRGIEEIYGFVEAALKAGQKEIPVHIFPFRLTEANIARETGGGWLALVGGGGYQQWAGFWKNLKEGYDLFEQTGQPPVAFACGDHYEFGGGSASCRRVAGW